MRKKYKHSSNSNRALKKIIRVYCLLGLVMTKIAANGKELNAQKS
jgi:hypothetical protein